MAKKILIIFIFGMILIPMNVSAANQNIEAIFINGSRIEVKNENKLTISLPNDIKRFSYNITAVNSDAKITGTGIMDFNGVEQTYEATVDDEKFTLTVVGREPAKNKPEKKSFNIPRATIIAIIIYCVLRFIWKTKKS